MITRACKECEEWEKKDILYITGVVNNNRIKSLCAVYGSEYAASKESYEKIVDTIKQNVQNTQGLEFSKTKELGRINKIDPLGITYLRLRGMWHIKNPFEVFSYVFKSDLDCDFNFFAIINSSKFNTFSNAYMLNKSGISVQNISVKNPDNPAKLIEAKLIRIQK